MLIGELATTTGVTAKTLRFYEASGLVPEPDPTNAGYGDNAGGARVREPGVAAQPLEPAQASTPDGSDGHAAFPGVVARHAAEGTGRQARQGRKCRFSACIASRRSTRCSSVIRRALWQVG